MVVFRPFLAIFSPNTWISFTKLKFRQSFWDAKWVYIIFGSKLMTKWKTYKSAKNAKNITQIRVFLQNRKKAEMEIFVSCSITFEKINCLIPQNDCLYLSFWKIFVLLEKKWPEVVLKRSFIIRKFWKTPSKSFWIQNFFYTFKVSK